MSFNCVDCDDYDDYYDDGEACMCPRCMGVGSVSCYCGGDQCYCENQGDIDCYLCEGRSEVSETVYEKYMKAERERMAEFHSVKFTYPHEKDKGQ